MITSLSRRAPLYGRVQTRIELAGEWTDLIPFANDNEELAVNATLVFHCNPDRIDSTRRAFREVGGQVIPFRSDFKGLRTWFPE